MNTHTYVLVVVQHEGRFVLIQEAREGNPWYVPAGRVNPLESLKHAALRETREEAGIDIELTGVLRVQHTPRPDGTARLRVWFAARPLQPSAPLKQTADHESLQARWVTLEEAKTLPLRGDEVIELLTASPVYPLTLLTHER